MNTGKTYLSLRKQRHSFPLLNNSSQKIKKLILEGISKFIANCHIQCTAGNKKSNILAKVYCKMGSDVFNILLCYREFRFLGSGFVNVMNHHFLGLPRNTGFTVEYTPPPSMFSIYNI